MTDDKEERDRQEAKSSQQKGKVLEAVAEMLYSVPGVEVRKRIWLLPPGGKKKRREIDILITASVVGYPVRFAIECKNEKKVVGATKIDAFRGKLELLGLPFQHGIYISPTGFTAAALEAAADIGMRTLVLGGLTKDRLQAEVLDAVQSMVFYLGYTKLLEWEVSGLAEDDPCRFDFYDRQSRRVGRPPDFLWKAWYVDEAVPLIVGEYDIPIHLPDGCHAIKDGVRYPVTSIRAKLGVKAFVVKRPGTAMRLELRNAADDSFDRGVTRMEFPGGGGYFPLQGFDSQEDFVEYLTSLGPHHLVLHVRMPRIQHQFLFWPMSPRVEALAREEQRRLDEGEVSELPPHTHEEVEGENLAVAFEPISLGDRVRHLEAPLVPGPGDFELPSLAGEEN